MPIRVATLVLCCFLCHASQKTACADEVAADSFVDSGGLQFDEGSAVLAGDSVWVRVVAKHGRAYRGEGLLKISIDTGAVLYFSTRSSHFHPSYDLFPIRATSSKTLLIQAATPWDTVFDAELGADGPIGRLRHALLPAALTGLVNPRRSELRVAVSPHRDPTPEDVSVLMIDRESDEHTTLLVDTESTYNSRRNVDSASEFYVPAHDGAGVIVIGKKEIRGYFVDATKYWIVDDFDFVTRCGGSAMAISPEWSSDASARELLVFVDAMRNQGVEGTSVGIFSILIDKQNGAVKNAAKLDHDSLPLHRPIHDPIGHRAFYEEGSDIVGVSTETGKEVFRHSSQDPPVCAPLGIVNDDLVIISDRRCWRVPLENPDRETQLLRLRGDAE